MSGNMYKHGLGPGPFIAHAARKEVHRSAPELARLDSPILADVLPSSNRCNGLQTLSCQTPASQSNSAAKQWPSYALSASLRSRPHKQQTKCHHGSLSDRQVQFGLSHLSLLGRADSGNLALAAENRLLIRPSHLLLALR